ncbi:MAG: hypothetical protein LBR26_07420 [Prevotella sp.]|jgi:hypothetical protein|nr:hypothetical protein [Prevotella sp.]
MTDGKDFIEYDGDDAVKFIQNRLPREMKGKYTFDEINYIIDTVYDFYDEKGFLDEETDEDSVVNIDEDEIVAYVLKCMQKDRINNFTQDEVAFIIQGELAYCDSIGIFE